jgi:predicted transcriptional regulator YheO
MDSMISVLKTVEPVAKAIASLLDPFAEVVVHDVRQNRVAAIYNNFSRRKKGDDSFIEDPAAFSSGPSVLGPFEKRGLTGRRIRYTTSVLRDDRGEAVGLMCVNLDVQALVDMRAAIDGFLGEVPDSSGLDRLFDDDWQDRINAYVREYLQERGLHLAELTGDERAALIHALHRAGGFRAKKAASHVASVLGISRTMVYKHLGRLSNRNQGGSR